MGQSASHSQQSRPDDGTMVAHRFPVGRYQIKNAPFLAAIAEFSGKGRFETDDPRWNLLFNPDILIEILEHPYSLSEFALRLIQNNPSTRNLLQLMEQIIANIKFAIRKKGALPDTLVPQCCTALFLATNMLHFFFMFLSTSELREQLGLPASWPETGLQIQTSPKGTGNTIEKLLDTLVTVISTPNEELSDIKFFAMEQLICMASCAMYRNTVVSAEDRVVTDDIFLRHLYYQASSELQHNRLSSLAYDPSSTAGGMAFTECGAVKLMKGLLQCSLGGVLILGQTTANPDNPNPTTVLQKTVEVSTQGGFLSNLQFRMISHRSGYDTEVNIIESVQKLVMSVLHFPMTLVNRLLRSEAYEAGPVAEEAQNTADPFDEAIVPDQMFPIHLLKDRSLQLLLLLIHQKQDIEGATAVSLNPFREVFNLLVDDRLNDNMSADGDDVEMVQRRGAGPLSVNKVYVDFDLILEDLIKLLPGKEYALMLYSLLQMHGTFPDILRQTGHTQAILQACLQGLYENATLTEDDMDIDTINHIYTLVICILIIVQDRLLVEAIVTQVVQISYYKEISSFDLPIMEAVLLVALKVLNIAIYRLEDQYLLTNLCAIVMNLVNHIANINSYTSERIVKNIINMCKKVCKDENVLPAGAGPAAGGAVNVEDVELTTAGDSATVSNSERANKKADLSLVRIGLITLLHFSDTLLRSSPLLALPPSLADSSHRKHLADNTGFLYTLISSQSHVHRYLSSPPLLHFLATTEEQKAAPAGTNVTEVITNMNMISDKIPCIRYCSDINRMVRRYMDKVEEKMRESGGGSDQEHAYLSPEQAMAILREEMNRPMHHPSAAVQEGGDIEAAAAQAQSPHNPMYHDAEYSKAHFTYQEAENAQDFFVPYIWTTILLSTPELPWNWEKLARAAGEEE